MGHPQERNKLLIQYVKGKTVLHLGCVCHSWEYSLREDWIHRFIVKYAKEVQGLDILKEDAKILSQSGYDIKYGDAEDFDLGKQFDVIFAGDLIEHLENFRGFIESCKKHMKKDSKLIITTPNCLALGYVIPHLFNRTGVNPEHTCWLDEKTLGQLLKRHDLKVDEVTYVHTESGTGIKQTILWTVLGKIPRSSQDLFVVASKRE